MFVKLSDNQWGTTQSHFVPSCLWSCHTSLDLLLNSLNLCRRVCEVVWQPLRYKTVSHCPIVFVKFCDNHWSNTESHFVTSCLRRCLTTIEVLTSLTFPIEFVELSENILGTKQSHFVPSCLRSCLATLDVLNSLTLCRSCLTILEVPNSLNLSDSVCDDIWPPLRY